MNDAEIKMMVAATLNDYRIECSKECDDALRRLSPEQIKLLELNDRDIETWWRNNKWHFFITQKLSEVIEENIRLKEKIKNENTG